MLMQHDQAISPVTKADNYPKLIDYNYILVSEDISSCSKQSSMILLLIEKVILADMRKLKLLSHHAINMLFWQCLKLL